MTDLEVPEPDAAEQAQPVADVPTFVRPALAPEVPEADALEQATVAPVDDEERLR